MMRQIAPLFAFLLLLHPCAGFVVIPATTTTATTLATLSLSEPLSVWDGSGSSSSTPLLLSVETLDPTTFLSDVFGAVLGTPLLLAIPIVAALGVATLIAFLIVSYANPAEPED